MAYESGSNIFSYCAPVFHKYRNDRMIFYKALQIIQFYQSRRDYPYCFDELIEAVDKVLGGNLITFFFHGYIFINAEQDEDFDPTKVYDSETDSEISIVEDWPLEEVKSLSRVFGDDIQAFTLALSNLSRDYFSKEEKKDGLRTIAYQVLKNNELSLKIIRNDDNAFELTLSIPEMEFMITQLENIKNQNR